MTMDTEMEKLIERLDQAVHAAGNHQRVIDRACRIATALQIHHAFSGRTLPVEEAVAKLEAYVASGEYLKPIRWRVTKGRIKCPA